MAAGAVSAELMATETQGENSKATPVVPQYIIDSTGRPVRAWQRVNYSRVPELLASSLDSAGRGVGHEAGAEGTPRLETSPSDEC